MRSRSTVIDPSSYSSIVTAESSTCLVGADGLPERRISRASRAPPRPCEPGYAAPPYRLHGAHPGRCRDRACPPPPVTAPGVVESCRVNGDRPEEVRAARPGHRAGDGPQGLRGSARPTRSGRSSGRTTATSPPTTSPSAPTSTCTPPWRRSSGSPTTARRAGPTCTCSPRATPTTAGRPAVTRSIEIVTDDMSFLVDSVTMELARQQREIHLVIHPQFDVVRDITGVLESVHPIKDESKPPVDGAIRESWMHIEISRLGADEDPARSRSPSRRSCARSATPSRTGRRCAPRPARSSTSSPPRRRRWTRSRSTAAGPSCTWLADDHFAFLGYREYHLEREGDDEILRAVPGTGLGILRADQDQSKAFAKLPDAAKAKAREKTLLVLSKANSRATVHRPAYLDYVGVKTFDENGDVTRRAPVPRPAVECGVHGVDHPHPAAAREGRRGAGPDRRRAAQPRGQEPDGHPRDLPARRDLPHPGRGAGRRDPGRAADRRPSPAAGVRPPRDLRPLRLGALLPAA